jgi:hypothetical protein
VKKSRIDSVYDSFIKDKVYNFFVFNGYYANSDIGNLCLTDFELNKYFIPLAEFREKRINSILLN